MKEQDAVAYIWKRTSSEGGQVSFYVCWKQAGRWRKRSCGTRRSWADEYLKLKQAEETRERLGLAPSTQQAPSASLGALLAAFRAHLEINVSLASAARYSLVLGHFETYARQNALEDVDSVSLTDIEGFKRWRAAAPRATLGKPHATGQTISRRSVNYELSVLSAVFNHGMKYLGLRTNPVHGVQRFRETRSERAHLTESEVQVLLRHVAGQWLAPAVATLVRTGLRLGELAGLRWRDVDLDERLLTVRSSWDGPPKNREQRLVPFPTELLAVLPGGYASEHVFTKPNGGPLDKHLSRSISREAKKAGLTKRVGSHTLRHSYASNLLKRGVDLRTVAELIGDSVEVTARTYLHSDLGTKRRAVEEAFLAPERSGPGA